MVVIKLIEGLPVLSHPRATNDQTYIGIFKTIYIYIYIYIFVRSGFDRWEWILNIYEVSIWYIGVGLW